MSVDIFSSMTQEDSLLIEFDRFLGDMSKICSFVLDDENELKELTHILSQIKEIDKNATTYVRTYGVDKREDDTFFIYGDNLWLDTTIGVDELSELFFRYDEVDNPLRGIVPCYISSLEEESFDGLKYVLYKDGRVEDFSRLIMGDNLKKFKSLYWD